MMRLGEHLLKLGLVDPRQLAAAVHAQGQQRARLGSLLVQAGALTVEQLAAVLSKFQDTPLPPQAWLQQPDPAAVAHVSRPLIERHRVIPLRLDHAVLHVALLDPNSPRLLEAIRGVTGQDVRPYILPELVMEEWLQWLFGVPPAILEPIAAPEMDLTTPDLPGATPIGWLSAGRAPSTRPGRRSARATGQLRPLSRTAEPRTLAELEEGLRTAPDRRLLLELALEAASRFCTHVAALAVQPDGLVATHMRRHNGPLTPLLNVRVPRTAGSIWSRAVAGATPALRAPVTAGSSESELLINLTRTEVTEFALLPVAIRGRVVMVLYADDGEEPVADSSLTALMNIARQLEGAYLRLILERKRRRSG